MSELVTIVAACHSREMVKQGRASVERALRNLMALSTAYGDVHSADNAKALASESALTDIRILACALHHVMKEGSADTHVLLAKTTAEGVYRKVRGKHVIVSMGPNGVIWIGPKSAVTRRRAVNNIPQQRSSNDAVAIDDETSMKIFTAYTLFEHKQDDSSSNVPKFSTNGAGDSFCAGVIAAMLDSDCDELDTECIHSGLASAAKRIIQNATIPNR